MASDGLSKIEHVVVLMLENRSFDNMLGFLYADRGNVSPLGHPFEGLKGNESNPDQNDKPVKVFGIKKEDPLCYFFPRANPGEGFPNTNVQLFGKNPPDPPDLPKSTRPAASRVTPPRAGPAPGGWPRRSAPASRRPASPPTPRPPAAPSRSDRGRLPRFPRSWRSARRGSGVRP